MVPEIDRGVKVQIGVRTTTDREKTLKRPSFPRPVLIKGWAGAGSGRLVGGLWGLQKQPQSLWNNDATIGRRGRQEMNSSAGDENNENKVH